MFQKLGKIPGNLIYPDTKYDLLSKLTHTLKALH